MSTSPSWFDQEKFSRLVKKVGPKNVSEAPSAHPPTSSGGQPPAPTVPQPAPSKPASSVSQPLPASPSASQPIPAPSSSQSLPKPENVSAHSNGPSTEEASSPLENLASTARISLVSKPPSLLNENRALPALPRRTTPLPGLKSLFQSPAPGDKSTDSGSLPAPPPLQVPPAIQPPPLPDTFTPGEGASSKSGTVVKIDPFPKVDEAAKPEPAAKAEPMAKSEMPALSESAPFLPKVDSSLADEEDDLSGIWQKMALLNEELAQTIQERDHANNDINLLREQLRQADEAVEKSQALAATTEETGPGRPGARRRGRPSSRR